MRVAGLGFRAAAGLDSLRDALMAAGGPSGVAALATVADKAGAAPLCALARELNVPVCAIPPEALAEVETPTWSARVAARFGTGSLAEAAALAGAGPGARLLSARAVSGDGMATAAIAEGLDDE